MEGEDSPASSTRLVIADDHALVREGVRSLLEREPDLEVVGEAEDGREAVELCRSLRPELVLMDLRMPEIDGIAATRAIKRELPHTIVLILTGLAEPDYLLKALKAGAAGYVLKYTISEEMLDAIRKALSGESPLDEELVARSLRQLADEMHEEEKPAVLAPGPRGSPEETCVGAPDEHLEALLLLGLLTPREAEVLRLMVQGHTKPGDSPSALDSPEHRQEPRAQHHRQARGLGPYPGSRTRRRTRPVPGGTRGGRGTLLAIGPYKDSLGSPNKDSAGPPKNSPSDPYLGSRPHKPPYVRANWLEDLMWADVRRFLEDPGEVLERVREQFGSEDNIAELEARRDELAKRLATRQAEKDRYIRTYAQGHISEEELDVYLADLKNQADTLRLLLESVEADLSDRRERTALTDTTHAWLLSLRRRVAEAEEDTEEAFRERRQLVKLLVNSISVGKRQEDGRAEIQITYRFGPPASSGASEEDSSVGAFKNGSRS